MSSGGATGGGEDGVRASDGPGGRSRDPAAAGALFGGPGAPLPPAAAARLLEEALERLAAGFDHLPERSSRRPGGLGSAGPGGLPDTASGSGDPDVAALRSILAETAERLHENYPYHHPLYAGQMLKPPHPVARLAYELALVLNPNNHALDGGRASSAMEVEAVGALARMFGWEEHLGHLTGGGTMANLEALWVASRLDPGATVLASAQAHYTHRRLCELLRVPFEEVAADRHGRIDVGRLETRLARGDVGTVVATAGTTALGSVDPLPELLELRERHAFRLHVDAAYGGYFALASNLQAEERAAFDRIGEADSIVVDPHKHGLQPYGCGCVLFRDPGVGRLYKHDSPYTYFTSEALHLGEISLECSRPGAAAVALWATQRLLPLERGGAFARGLEACREAAVTLHAALTDDPGFRVALPPALDIVVWSAERSHGEESGGSDVAAVLSHRNAEVFQAAAERDLHLALARLPVELLAGWWPDLAATRLEVETARAAAAEAPEGNVVCLRSCLMKPEHREWLPELLARLRDAARRRGL